MKTSAQKHSRNNEKGFFQGYHRGCLRLTDVKRTREEETRQIWRACFMIIFHNAKIIRMKIN